MQVNEDGELENNDANSPEVIESANEDNSADISQHEEAAASARGWVPKDKFRGREDDWQDAKSFLDRNASLQTEVRELRERVHSQDETYADRLRRIEAANDRIIREDRERLLTQLSNAKRNAVELGDTDEYDRLERQEYDYFARQVENERTERVQTQPRQKAPDLLPETQDWLRRNSWFNENQAMQAIALGFYTEATEGMPASKDENKRLAYVDKKMQSVYPEKFGGNTNSSSVEGGNRGSGSNKITNLSAAERAACKKFIAKGIIKNEAEYIKYLNEYD